MKRNTSINSKRQVILDVETTGMNVDSSKRPCDGHKIIEIGAVEIVDRRLTANHFHAYINPNRQVDEVAFSVHGINNDMLKDKPLFAEIAHKFIDFVDGAELIIHNASFDVAFIDYEFALMGYNFKVAERCLVTDTLAIARRLFPGKRNSLDVLCERYKIDNSERTLHSALLDAKLLAEVYLAMTGGQTLFSFSADDNMMFNQNRSMVKCENVQHVQSALCMILANDKELACHEQMLDNIEKKAGHVIWRNIE